LKTNNFRALRKQSNQDFVKPHTKDQTGWTITYFTLMSTQWRLILEGIETETIIFQENLASPPKEKENIKAKCHLAKKENLEAFERRCSTLLK